MSIFTILILVILAPLLKRLGRVVGYALIFPLALIAMAIKAIFAPKQRKPQFSH